MNAVAGLDTRLTDDHHESLRLWLRLLTCTHLIETHVRKALATQFKTTDMRHMSPDKLEAARRQAAHGERLCKSAPEIGVKALDLAFKDAGFAPM